MLTPFEIQAFEEFEKRGWERAATAYHDHWGRLSAQSALPMLRAAGVGRGSMVLDIATGAGYVAAEAVSLGGTATGLDFSAAQVDLAQSIYPDVAFRQGDAQDLPFGDETFDVVVMGFGMNHLPDPEQAAAQAWRVLKPGGVYGFTVWAEPQAGQGFGIVLSAIEENSVPNPDLPAAPPYFRFANGDEAKAVLSGAGFSNISTTTVPQFWRHSTPDQVYDAFNEGAVRATAMLRSQPENVRETIKNVVRDEVVKLKLGDEYVIPVPAALTVGHKPD